jgi:hypothetical protein
MRVDEIDRLFELLFLGAFAVAAAGSLVVAKLVQRIRPRPARRRLIILSYLGAPVGAFAALWLALRPWPQLAFSGLSVATLLAIQVGLLAADLFTVQRSPGVAEVFEEVPAPASRTWRWKAGIWLLGLLASYGLARLAVNADRARAVMAEAPADVAEAHAWRAAPDILRELRRLFPDDYRRILRDHPAPEGVLALAEPETDRRYHAWLLQVRAAVHAFILAQRPNILRAPDDALLATVRGERALFGRLQPYPTVCAARAAGRSDPTDPASRQVASPATVDAIIALEIAQIRAARAGLDRPTARDFASLRRPAQAALSTRLRAASPEIARLFNDPTAATQATPTLQCRAALAYYDVLLAMPPALAAALVSDTAPVPTAGGTGP